MLYTVEQLSPCTAATEPMGPRACAPQQEKPPQWEAFAPRLECSSCTLQLEKAHTQQWRPSAARSEKKKTWFGSSSSCPRCPQAELGRPSGQQDSASSTVRSPSSDRLQEAFCFLPFPLGQDVVPSPLGMMGLLHHSRAFSSSGEPALKV